MLLPFLDFARKRYPHVAVTCVVILVTLRIASNVYYTNHRSRYTPPPGWGQVAKANTIANALYRYANDHGGKYPDGTSSTEIFQKLVDAEYLSDPTVLYEPSLGLPDKYEASSRQLKPENVCWDVTVPADSLTPEALPLVFETGFRVEYIPGGGAAPVISYLKGRHAGIAVCYAGLNTAYFAGYSIDGSISNFVPSGFDPQGKGYVQLTPTGLLPEFRALVNRPPKN
jgi:hypothetical protein